MEDERRQEMKIDLVELYNDPNASVVLPVGGDEFVRIAGFPNKA